MRFCFTFGLFASLVAAPGAQSSRRVTSVVRTDVRTGRLIRSVVVQPKAVVARVVSSGQDLPTAPAAAPDANLDVIIDTAAKRYEVDPLLIHSVIQVESNYNPLAVSPKGAQGIMQLIPSTARRFGVRNVFDPRENIEGGVKYLKYLNELFPNDLRLAIAAYNAGEGAVVKYNNNIPPYRETEKYVYRVGTRYGKARRSAIASKKATEPQAAPAETAAATVEKYLPVEYFVDSEGRLNMKTQPVANP